MKRTIATIVLIFAMANAMAQTPDSMPPINMKVDTMPVLDTAKKWNNDSSMQQGWKKDSTAKWKTDTTSMKQPSLAKDSTATNAGQKNNAAADTAAKEKLSDRVVMKEGQMMLIKNGEEMKMEKDVTLSSGTVITRDGMVKKKDGSSVKLKDGQYIALPAATDKKPALKKQVEKKAPLKKSNQ
jgi:hypothetical protein